MKVIIKDDSSLERLLFCISFNELNSYLPRILRDAKSCIDDGYKPVAYTSEDGTIHIGFYKKSEEDTSELDFKEAPIYHLVDIPAGSVKNLSLDSLSEPLRFNDWDFQEKIKDLTDLT